MELQGHRIVKFVLNALSYVRCVHPRQCVNNVKHNIFSLTIFVIKIAQLPCLVMHKETVKNAKMVVFSVKVKVNA